MFVQKLRGDNDVAKLFQESLIIISTETGIQSRLSPSAGSYHHSCFIHTVQTSYNRPRAAVWRDALKFTGFGNLFRIRVWNFDAPRGAKSAAVESDRSSSFSLSLTGQSGLCSPSPEGPRSQNHHPQSCITKLTSKILGQRRILVNQGFHNLCSFRKRRWKAVRIVFA
jgi:hypothetical protein